MNDLAPKSLHNAREIFHLLPHRRGDPGGGHRQFLPPEVRPVWIAGMRSDANSVPDRKPRAPLHAFFLSGMAAAGDAGGGDVFHQSGFEREILELTHIAVQVNRHSSE